MKFKNKNIKKEDKMKKVLILKYIENTVLINVDHIIDIDFYSQHVIKVNKEKPVKEKILAITTIKNEHRIAVNREFSLSSLQQFLINDSKFFEIKGGE
jgi:hypothetical protein